MGPNASSRIKWLILVVAAAAVLPPAMFGTPRIIEGEAGGDPWRNFILDFQTLIGGLFAVFAAWWTVSVMQSTDNSAERRHQEQLSLLTREHDAKFRRMLAKVPGTLREKAAKMRDFETLIPEGSWEPVWTREAMMKVGIAILAMRNVNALISDPVLTNCRELFPPSVAELVGQLEDWAAVSDTIVSADIAAIADLFRAGQIGRPEWYDNALVPVLWQMRTAAESVASDLEVWGETMISRR